ncbi:MAG TPA: substrate-binding domain-containing protein [Burkholderiales bacterium]
MVPSMYSNLTNRGPVRASGMCDGWAAGGIPPAAGAGAGRLPRRLRLGVALALLVIAAEAAAQERELRVCADPDNLPFSNERLEGFENKIAKLIADDLNASLQYTWASQRGRFVRQTLKAGKCDLIIGVPVGFEPVLSTKPYYRSTYVFVYAKSRNLDLRSFDDPALRKLKIGLHAFGNDGANSPPAHALARRGITRNIVGFTILDTDDSPPGRIIDAVAKGDIDVAIVWGPFAGYFAARAPVELEVVPVSSGTDVPAMPFTFEMSMGVRRGETALKEQMEGILERRRSDIQKILVTYGVPLVSETPLAASQP